MFSGGFCEFQEHLFDRTPPAAALEVVTQIINKEDFRQGVSNTSEKTLLYCNIA